MLCDLKNQKPILTYTIGNNDDDEDLRSAGGGLRRIERWGQGGR